MLQIKYDCPNCNKEGILEFGESIILDELRWYATQICSNCDFATEMDDEGSLPSYLRDVVLRDTGIWYLQIGVPLHSELLKVLREELDLSMEEIKVLKRTGLTDKTTGTYTEMKLMKIKLAQVTSDESIILKKRGNE